MISGLRTDKGWQLATTERVKYIRIEKWLEGARQTTSVVTRNAGRIPRPRPGVINIKKKGNQAWKPPTLTSDRIRSNG